MVEEKESGELLDRVTRDVNELPSLPFIIMQIIKLLDDPKATVNDLQQIIGRDQALAAKVLRLANSAFYGFSRKIATLSEAVIILGFNTLKSIAFAASAYKVFNKKLTGYSLEHGALWKHSMGTAMGARMIAKKAGLKDVELAFVSGLLHDIGMLILNYYVNEKAVEVYKVIEEKNINFVDAERDVFGFDHCTVGSRVAMKWRLPEILQEVLLNHHRPGNAKQNQLLVNTVSVADVVCYKSGLGLKGNGFNYSIRQDVLNQVNLTKNDVDEITEIVSKLSSEFEQMFGEQV